MNPNILLNNPALKNISPEKLQFLLQFASDHHNKNPKEMLPLFLAAQASAKKTGISFEENELHLILDIMKQHMNESEIKKMEMILKIFQQRKGDTP